MQTFQFKQKLYHNVPLNQTIPTIYTFHMLFSIYLQEMLPLSLFVVESTKYPFLLSTCNQKVDILQPLLYQPHAQSVVILDTLLELIFAGINFRVELIFANWPNSRKLNPAKQKTSYSRKLIPAKCPKSLFAKINSREY